MAEDRVEYDNKTATGDVYVSSNPSALSAVAPDDVPGAAPEDQPYVEYKGKGHIRRISLEAWHELGVTDQEFDTVWDDGNEFRVPVSNICETALAILRKDGSFSVPAAH